jgi:hypothetical protein
VLPLDVDTAFQPPGSGGGLPGGGGGSPGAGSLTGTGSCIAPDVGDALRAAGGVDDGMGGGGGGRGGGIGVADLSGLADSTDLGSGEPL